MPGEGARPVVNPVAPGFTAGGFLFAICLVRDPEKACPALDAGWVPVFG